MRPLRHNPTPNNKWVESRHVPKRSRFTQLSYISLQAKGT